MSAYMVSRKHIQYMVEAGFRHPGHHWNLSWYWNGSRSEMRAGDYTEAERAGQMLWDENRKSIEARYPDCVDNPENMPGPIGESFEYGRHKHSDVLGIDPVKTLKLIACYEYQACEHDGWEASEAHAYCQALRRSAINALPGYDDAPWGLN